VLNGKPLKFPSQAFLQANTTRAIAFSGPAPFASRVSPAYEKQLHANASSFAPRSARKKSTGKLAAHAKRSGLDTHEDAALRKLVVYSTNFPPSSRGLRSRLPQSPDEILVTVMRDHQKYFAVEKKNGDLAPHFLTVINVAGDTKASFAPDMSVSPRALCRRAVLLGLRPEVSARRLSAEARAHLPMNPASAATATKSSASLHLPLVDRAVVQPWHAPGPRR